MRLSKNKRFQYICRRFRRFSGAHVRLVWLENAWIKPRLTQFRRIRVFLTVEALIGVIRWNIRKGRFTNGLRDEARHLLHYREFDRTSASLEWNFRFIETAFTDFYMSQEFDDVFRGLLTIQNLCGSDLFSQREHLEDFFRSAKSRVGGGSLNVGWFDCTKLPWKLRPWSFSGVHVFLVQASPSVMTLTLIAKPTDRFKESLKSLMFQDRVGEPEVQHLYWKIGLAAMSHLSARGTMQAEYDELFLTVNAELSRILRAYIRAGICLRGPLQTVEVFAFDRELEELPRPWSEPERQNHLLDGFFQCLGREANPFSTYRSGCFELYPVERDANYDISSYQILVSTPHYWRDHPTKVPEGTSDKEIRHSLSYTHLAMSPFMGILYFYRFLQRSVLEVRNNLVPVLHAESAGRRSFSKIRAGHEKIAYADGLALQQRRVWSELTERPSRLWIADDLSGFRRTSSANLDNGTERFDDSFWRWARETHTFCATQIDLIRAAFRDLLQFKAVEVNDRVQRQLFWLTILATIAAVVDLLPEATRANVFPSICRWLRTLWTGL